MPAKKQPETTEEYTITETVRRVLLAGIGAIALTQEQIEKFVDQLIERGEIAEKEGKTLLKEIMEKRKKDAEKAEDEFTTRMETVFKRLNVPTKNDIQKLTEEVNELSKKVDELNVE